jgi:Interferon-induced transmembrane protein
MVRECPKCRLVNPPEALRCDCGYDFIEKRGGHVQPPTFLVPAVLTLLLSLPFGVVALAFSQQVRPRFTTGDLAGARRASTWAGVTCAVGLTVAAVVGFLLFPS